MSRDMCTFWLLCRARLLSGTWDVTVLDSVSGEVFRRRSRILISAVGALSVPRKREIHGAEGFKRTLFHSAQWDHSFNWAGKDVVVIGEMHVDLG